MKNYLILVILICGFLPAALNAQTLDLSKKGTEINVEISNQDNFMPLFEEHQNGTITFKDNQFARAILNIDLLSNEIVFLGENNMLLPIEDQNNIKHVIIGKDVFFKSSKGFIQVIANVNNIQLGIIRSFKIKNIEKSGAYGKPSSTSSTQQVSRLQDSKIDATSFSDLTMTQKAILGYVEDYYLVQNNRHILIRGTRQFSRVFSIDRKLLDEYVKKENIDFSNHDDLLKLYNYCNSL